MSKGIKVMTMILVWVALEDETDPLLVEGSWIGGLAVLP